jgi:hypothetical protein
LALFTILLPKTYRTALPFWPFQVLCYAGHRGERNSGILRMSSLFRFVSGSIHLMPPFGRSWILGLHTSLNLERECCIVELL